MSLITWLFNLQRTTQKVMNRLDVELKTLFAGLHKQLKLTY